jgi:hypothetical protein
MSRAYRISASESASRIIRASDRVSTQLEILDILPCSEIASLLRDELVKAGFEESEDEPDLLVRRDNGITITIDPTNAEVVVSSTEETEVELESTRRGHVYEEQSQTARQKAEEALARKARQDLNDQQEATTEELQKKITDNLEAALLDVQRELGQVVNRVTANALKVKASRMGEIKELTEDPQSGSMTIVVEV